jgi:ABC-type uncharacterized transport system ATPase subunit
MVTVISARGLRMTFHAPVREAGVQAAFRALFQPHYREVKAVQDVSFRIQAGEVVGFIGPNGAGKTTTLKMLAGILHPSAGSAEVLGFVPWKRDHRYLRQIAMIRGSRPLSGPGEQTVLDAFRLQQLVYEVPESDFQRNLAELSDLLNLAPLLERQRRALSLGERMRAGLACSLLYRPRVLFLDEPTIGMDVSATADTRRFLDSYARQSGATVLLTSHYMADVEQLCRRIILIDRGTLRYDGDLEGLATTISPFKLLKVVVNTAPHTGGPPVTANQATGTDIDLSRFGEIVETKGGKVSLRVRREEVPAVASRLLTEVPVSDLSIENPPLESVIDRVYRQGVTS